MGAINPINKKRIAPQCPEEIPTPYAPSRVACANRHVSTTRTEETRLVQLKRSARIPTTRLAASTRRLAREEFLRLPRRRTTLPESVRSLRTDVCSVAHDEKEQEGARRRGRPVMDKRE